MSKRREKTNLFCQFFFFSVAELEEKRKKKTKKKQTKFVTAESSVIYVYADNKFSPRSLC